MVYVNLDNCGYAMNQGSDYELKKTIALVEDDDLIRENYSELLADEGYVVSAYSDRYIAFDRIIADPPNLAILDIGLGRERDGGFELCRLLRENNNTMPIIFLTSYDSDDARIRGFECDVDDYIVKGESIDFLIVRVAALFRRIHSLSNTGSQKTNTLERGDLLIDFDSNRVQWKAKSVTLTLTQYWILKELAMRPGKTKSISKLMSVANMVVEPNTIVSNIKTIRRRFKEVDTEFNCIKTEYSAGYRWLDPLG